MFNTVCLLYNKRFESYYDEYDKLTNAEKYQYHVRLEIQYYKGKPQRF